jgi:hypothetical protein
MRVGVEQVSRLFRESAADVPAPQLAEAAWAQAVRVRRRRQNVLAGTVLATTVVAASAVVVAVRGAGDHTPVAPQTSAPSTVVGIPPVAVDRIPATPPVRTGTALPRNAGNLAASPVLASGAIQRADALYEPSGGGTEPQPVYALSGRAFHRLRVALQFALDPAKKFVSPLRPTSLSADGRLAAFPQRDAVLMVDLTTARVTQVKIPGFNEQVLWLTSGSLLVGQQGAAYVVDVDRASATRLPGSLSVADVVAGVSSERTVLELADTPGLPLREWTLGTATSRVDSKADFHGLAGYRVTRWSGPAWRSGDLLVRAGQSNTAKAEVVVVLDALSGRVVRLLAATATPLGWLDQHTVVLQASKGVLAWDVDTGGLTSIAAPFDGTLALP